MTGRRASIWWLRCTRSRCSPIPSGGRPSPQIGHLVRLGGTLIVIARAADRDENRHPRGRSPAPRSNPSPPAAFARCGSSASATTRSPCPCAAGGPSSPARATRTQSARRRPILRGKAHGEASVLTAGNLLWEARRQRRLPEFRVPAACLLDSYGDVVPHLADRGTATEQPAWGCDHTRL
jgi:hypothetical protein